MLRDTLPMLSLVCATPGSVRDALATKASGLGKKALAMKAKALLRLPAIISNADMDLIEITTNLQFAHFRIAGFDIDQNNLRGISAISITKSSMVKSHPPLSSASDMAPRRPQHSCVRPPKKK